MRYCAECGTEIPEGDRLARSLILDVSRDELTQTMCAGCYALPHNRWTDTFGDAR